MSMIIFKDKKESRVDLDEICAYWKPGSTTLTCALRDAGWLELEYGNVADRDADLAALDMRCDASINELKKAA